ncbi:MAG: hypothetical protein AAGC66_16710 [Leifsonia sp.]
MKRTRRGALAAAAAAAIVGGSVLAAAPAGAATLTQHVGVLYTSKIYHYADSFGQIQHSIVAGGKTIRANWASPGIWSDQGLSYAGITKYWHEGRA